MQLQSAFSASCTAARQVTMRAWPVARSIFDAPLAPLCERSERADNRLDNAASDMAWHDYASLRFLSLGLYSPNQVLTRAAAKQLNFRHLWWPRAARAKGSD